MDEDVLCTLCGKLLSSDETGLNRKIFDGEVKRGIWRCLACMAENLECDEAELLDKIEEFKAEGCKLFG